MVLAVGGGCGVKKCDTEKEKVVWRSGERKRVSRDKEKRVVILSQAQESKGQARCRPRTGHLSIHFDTCHELK